MVNGFELFKGLLEADALIKKKPRRVAFGVLARGQLLILAVGLWHYHDSIAA